MGTFYTGLQAHGEGVRWMLALTPSLSPEERVNNATAQGSIVLTVAVTVNWVFWPKLA
jgi:hypothetical protein